DLGVLERDQKDWQAAVATLTTALSLAPDDETALIARSLSYRGLERYKDARADAERAVARSPDVSGNWTERGLVELGAGNRARAIRYLSTPRDLDPGSPEPRPGRAPIRLAAE